MNFRHMLALLAASTCLAGPALAEQGQIIPVALQQDGQSDAEIRIRTSVKIKMRAQSISAAACHLQMGLDPSALSTPLDGQIAEFEQYVTALTAGDPSLNIMQPDERKKTHRAAQLVTDAWAPVKTAAMSIAEGTGQASDTDSILDHNYEILEHGHNFTAELVQQYANPAESTLADLFTIVLATRQSMLSQKMSKESCMVTYSGASTEKLGETMSVFENTLIALLIFSAIYLMCSVTIAILREQVSS